MTKVFKIKNLNCIEWTVNLSSTTHALISENFLLQGVNCKLKCELHSYGNVNLYCESTSQLKTAVDMIAFLSYLNNNSACEKCKFIGMRQAILTERRYGIRGVVTFYVIIFSDIFKGSPIEDTSGCLAFEESQPSSYLEKSLHFQAVCRDFSKLLRKRLSYDVVIKCEDKTFNVHKIVLQARSSVFDAMLKSNTVEGKTGTVNIKEIKSSVFECFLQYLYSGVLPKISKENAKEFYRVGDQYDVKEFKQACSEFMIMTITEQNACDILVLADLHHDKDFREKVIEYIVDKKIPQRDKNWSDFCKIHCTLANEILNLYIKKHCLP